MIFVIELCLGYILFVSADGAVYSTTALGFTLDERLILLGVALVPSVVAVLARPRDYRLPALSPILIFLIYVVGRTLVGGGSLSTAGGLVDLRDPLFLLSVIPFAVWAQDRGSLAVTRTVLRLAYLQAGVTVIAYFLLRAGLLSSSEGVFGIYDTGANALARVGSEFLVPWALVVSPMRSHLHRRPLFYATTALLVAALIFSGTLTNAIGVVVALAAYLLFSRGRARSRLIVVSLVSASASGLILFAIPGSYQLSSRFDLLARASTSSVSVDYRVSEFSAAEARWLGQDLGTAMFGAGPDALIAFDGGGSYGIVVKGDTHNAYMTLGLQFGVVGLFLACVVFIQALRLPLPEMSPEMDRLALRSGILLLLVVSVAAPYLVGSAGYTFVALMVGLGLPARKENLSQRLRAVQPTNGSVSIRHRALFLHDASE